MSDEASGLTEDRKNLWKRAFSMAQGTLTSRILGLFRDMAMGALFDRAVTDAWVAAFRLPNFFRRLLGEGSLSGAFIPLYIQAQKEDPTGKRAQGFLNLVTLSLGGFMAFLCLVAVVWMHPLLSFFLGSTNFSAAKWEWTVLSGQIMFLFVFFISLASIWGAVLQVRGQFGWVGLAPALLNIAMLIFTLLPGRWFTFPGESLAWGVFAGGFLQLVLLGTVSWVQGLKIQISLAGPKKILGQFYKTFALALVGVGVFQLSALIHLYFASGLQEGSISALYWADRLMELPLSLVSVSLGASLLPSLSHWYAEKNKAHFWLLSSEALSLSLFWAVPAALGLFLYAEPLITLLFKRGEFHSQDLLRTVTVLKIQALSLVAMSANRVLLPIYYSRGRTTFPLWVSLAGLGVQAWLSAYWMRPSEDLASLRALMEAGFIAHAGTSVILLLGLKAEFYWKEWGARLSKTLLSSLVLVAIFYFSKPFLKTTQPGPLGGILAGIIFISIVSYGLMAFVLKSPEALKIHQSCRLWLGRPRRKG